MAEHVSQPPVVGREHGWRVIAASAPGAHHHRSGLPSQDAWQDAPLPCGGLVVAVADGHGHPRHFRSGRGSQMATDAACAAVAAHWRDLGDAGSPEALAPLLAEGLVPDLWRRWRQAVDVDLVLDPFSAEEESARHPGDEPVIAYGSTLLAAALIGPWAVLVRIGDGDVVVARPDGSVREPLPKDPDLAGEQTTSLCQADAVSAFRTAAVDLEAEPLSLLLLATDGYGTAQTDDPWQPSVGRDLVAMLSEHGPGWVQERLPGWASLCASTDGSGDDTTVALVVGGA